jgi:hypothetical protein
MGRVTNLIFDSNFIRLEKSKKLFWMKEKNVNSQQANLIYINHDETDEEMVGLKFSSVFYLKV